MLHLGTVILGTTLLLPIACCKLAATLFHMSVRCQYMFLDARKPCLQSTPSSDPFQIFVKLKKTIAVDVNASDSIWEVKRRIQDREGYSPKQLRRVYHRKVLADEKLLREYDAREHTACEFMRKS